MQDMEIKGGIFPGKVIIVDNGKLAFPAKSVIFPGDYHLAPAKLSMQEER